MKKDSLYKRPGAETVNCLLFLHLFATAQKSEVCHQNQPALLQHHDVVHYPRFMFSFQFPGSLYICIRMAAPNTGAALLYEDCRKSAAGKSVSGTRWVVIRRTQNPACMRKRQNKISKHSYEQNQTIFKIKLKQLQTQVIFINLNIFLHANTHNFRTGQLVF